MQRHVSQPDVVLLVHGDHVREEEGVLAPRVDGVSAGVDGEDGGLRDGHRPVQAVCVVAAEEELGTV